MIGELQLLCPGRIDKTKPKINPKPIISSDKTRKAQLKSAVIMRATIIVRDSSVVRCYCQTSVLNKLRVSLWGRICRVRFFCTLISRSKSTFPEFLRGYQDEMCEAKNMISYSRIHYKKISVPTKNKSYYFANSLVGE